MSQRVFLDAVRELREGATLHELGEQLVKLVQAVRDTGRPGSLKLELKVKPASKGSTVTVLALEDVITVKQPAAERGSTILYAGADNSLTRRDPRQPELPAMSVVPIRTAADAIPPQEATKS